MKEIMRNKIIMEIPVDRINKEEREKREITEREEKISENATAMTPGK